jgi:hypothetical protein
MYSSSKKAPQPSLWGPSKHVQAKNVISHQPGLWGPSKAPSKGPVKQPDPNASIPSSYSNEYKGFCIPDVGWQIDRVPASIESEIFFERYVKPRKPVVLTGLLQDESFRCHLWTNEYLISKAGESTVQVEQRSTGGGYGLGNKVEMTFKQFLLSLENGDELHYMTTQAIPADVNGLLDICAPPVTQLLGDLPLPPLLTGNLVLWQINMWMGATLNG